MQARQNTKLEAEGAEFLVLGNLLRNGIEAYKTYSNYPDYDILAVNPESHRNVRVQVKSRWATNYDKSFQIRNVNCEFVVLVSLNLGYRFGKTAKGTDTGIHNPEYFIFPAEVVTEAQSTGNPSKVRITSIPDYKKYEDAWQLISAALTKK